MKKSTLILGTIIAFAIVGLAASAITSSVAAAIPDEDEEGKKKKDRNPNSLKVCEHNDKPKKCDDGNGNEMTPAEL